MHIRDSYITKSGVRPLSNHSEPQYCSEPISARSKTSQPVISAGKLREPISTIGFSFGFTSDWLRKQVCQWLVKRGWTRIFRLMTELSKSKVTCSACISEAPTKTANEWDVCIHGNKVSSAGCVPGTNAYTPPEYISAGRYDGSQGTVWQVGILLVEILSPVMPFDKPEHALKMGPRIPEQLSSGNKLEYTRQRFDLKTGRMDHFSIVSGTVGESWLLFACLWKEKDFLRGMKNQARAMRVFCGSIDGAYVASHNDKLPTIFSYLAPKQ